RRGAIRTSQGRILALLGRGAYYAGRFTFWYLTHYPANIFWVNPAPVSVEENNRSVISDVR
ncbi:hypothetical protein, partial [Azotobacter beijerinckii]|uniref:hypothetical protein n=1 Tax=Azotobacter beijerinckii TaxID=170623 RepID=UPI001C3123A7